MNEELKPCSFCGVADIIRRNVLHNRTAWRKKRVGHHLAEEITVCVVREMKNVKYTALENCFDFKVKPFSKKINY